MSQEKIETRQPNLTRYSHKEINEMVIKGATLLNEGKRDEADKIFYEIPLHWKSAKILKESIGLKAMIESGVNLSAAVDHYGIEWLKN